MIIDWTSATIGAILSGAVYLIVIFVFFGLRKKRHSLKEMKGLIKETHYCLKAAAENQVKLYHIFLDVEKNMEALP